MAGLGAGLVFSLSIALINGLSTYLMKDGQTLEEWARSTVGGA